MPFQVVNDRTIDAIVGTHDQEDVDEVGHHRRNSARTILSRRVSRLKRRRRLRAHRRRSVRGGHAARRSVSTAVES